jgi:hypothetical protein
MASLQSNLAVVPTAMANHDGYRHQRPAFS